MTPPPPHAASVDRSLRLRDGRRLCYAEYGDATGRPVLLLHGWPGSRLAGAPLAAAAHRRRVRLIVPDRPGLGRSDALPRRRLTDWAPDAVALLDHLALARIAAVGYSAGSAYALALAHAAPERLDAVAVVSPMAPLDDPAVRAATPAPMRAMLAAARRSERLASPALAAIARALRGAPRELSRRLVGLGLGAPSLLARPELMACYRDELVEAFRHGAQGVAREAAINGSPWGFRLEDLTPEIQLFHGEADRNVPVEVGRCLARRLPHCRGRFIAGADHFWIFDGFEEVLDALPPASAASPR